MGESCAFRLIETCRQYNYPLVFIGKDVWFKNFRQIKIDLILDALKTIDAEYTMYSDAPDSWILCPDLFTIYKQFFAEKIVVSANRDHYPETNLYQGLPFSKHTSFRFVCSSQFIGPTQKLIAFFETMRREYLGFVDQEGWNYLHVNKIADFDIDYYCRLFLNMTQVFPEEITEDFQLKETGTYPASIHFGGAKGDSPNGVLMAQFYEKFLLRLSDKK